MFDKVDYILDKMYSAALYVSRCRPPYLYGGHDPTRGIDCSGLGMFMLGRAGYNGTPGDLSTTGLGTYVYTRVDPDPRLGPRASELAALLLTYDNGVDDPTYHSAFYMAPRLVIHASMESWAIPLQNAFEEVEKDVENTIQYLTKNVWGEVTSASSVPKPRDPSDFSTLDVQHYLFDIDEYDPLIEGFHLSNKYDSFDWDNEVPADADEAKDFDSRIRKRIDVIQNMYPPNLRQDGRYYHSDLATYQWAAGVDRIREMLILHRLGLLDKPTDCISVVSESDFLNHFTARSNFAIEVKYMDATVLTSFNVPAGATRHYGSPHDEPS